MFGKKPVVCEYCGTFCNNIEELNNHLERCEFAPQNIERTKAMVGKCYTSGSEYYCVYDMEMRDGEPTGYALAFYIYRKPKKEFGIEYERGVKVSSIWSWLEEIPQSEFLSVFKSSLQYLNDTAHLIENIGYTALNGRIE